LKDNTFNELITKTTLMLGEGNTEPVLQIFTNIMESKRGRMMKNEYFQKYNITEEALEQIGAEAEASEENIPADTSKGIGNDLDDEAVDKVISVFEKIAEYMKEKGKETPEYDFVSGIIESLKSFKESGTDSDAVMKDVVDFLNNAGSTDEEEAPAEEPVAPEAKEPEVNF